MEMSDARHASATLPPVDSGNPEKSLRYPMHGSPGGPQRRSDCGPEKKNLRSAENQTPYLRSSTP
jgi:hypothetical protein